LPPIILPVPGYLGLKVPAALRLLATELKFKLIGV